MTDRRSLLRGLAALPIVSAPAVALAAVQSPDQRLLDLERRYLAADQAAKAACQRANALADLANSACPAKSNVLIFTKEDRWLFGLHRKAVGDYHAVDTYFSLQDAAQDDWSAFHQRRRARAHEVRAAFEAWEADCTAHEVAVGVKAADEECDVLTEQVMQLADDIRRTRPESVTGLAVKVRVADRHSCREMIEAMQDDILAMALTLSEARS